MEIFLKLNMLCGVIVWHCCFLYTAGVLTVIWQYSRVRHHPFINRNAIESCKFYTKFEINWSSVWKDLRIFNCRVSLFTFAATLLGTILGVCLIDNEFFRNCRSCT